jgi:hypothetical protein
MFIGLHVKYRLFLSDLKGNWIFWTVFRKIRKYQITWKSFLLKPTDELISQINFVKKFYMFRAILLPIIRSFPLYIRHWYMSCSFDDSLQAWPGWLCLKSVNKTASVSNVQWKTPWWWADELPETCRISWQNKFDKLVRLVGFITKKFVMMHGHMKVKFMKIRSVGAELFHADGPTDGHDESNSLFRNFVKTPKNWFTNLKW